MFTVKETAVKHYTGPLGLCNKLCNEEAVWVEAAFGTMECQVQKSFWHHDVAAH